MAYEPKEKGKGESDKPKLPTSAEVLQERTPGQKERAMINEMKPHLTPGELRAIWVEEKRQGK
jgi:hypothetical protein